MFQTISIILCAAAVLSWINYKFIRLPSTIGVMLISLIASLTLVLFGEADSGVRGGLAHLLSGIDFHAVVFHALLPFLLFAGALHVKLADLRREWLPLTLLAIAGTAASIGAVAGGLFLIFSALGSGLPWISCLLFGALISPTDPIAVLGIMKTAGASKAIETQIAGESLFNDGVGVVAFVTFLAIAAGDTPPSVGEAALLLCREIGGALLIGAATGAVAVFLLRGVDRYQIEVLLTLAVAAGSYALAEAMHASAPIAVVIAGLCVGNQGRALAMSPQSKRRVDEFWELIDEFLNVSLFLLIGLQLLLLPQQADAFWGGGVAIIVSLLARLIIVAAVSFIMKSIGLKLESGSVAVLTWGGLRGGVSLALALALPASQHRDMLLTAAYVVVVFSVLVQGLTIAYVIRRASRVS